MSSRPRTKLNDLLINSYKQVEAELNAGPDSRLIELYEELKLYLTGRPVLRAYSGLSHEWPDVTYTCDSWPPLETQWE